MNVTWTLEDNLDSEMKEILSKLKLGEISETIKTKNGYKIIKLKKKEGLVIANSNTHSSKFHQCLMIH